MCVIGRSGRSCCTEIREGHRTHDAASATPDLCEQHVAMPAQRADSQDDNGNLAAP